MVKALKFFIGGILLFSAEQAVSCTCLDDLGCEIVDRILVSGKIEKVLKEDGSIAKPGTILKPEYKDGHELVYIGNFYTSFTVLNSDDTTLIGKTIMLKAQGGGGASCGTGLYYGFVHFELHGIKEEAGRLRSSISSCTPTKYFSDKATLDAHIAQRLTLKEKCRKERWQKDSLTKASPDNLQAPVEFLQYNLLKFSEEKRDSITEMWLVMSREKLEAKVPSENWFDGKIIFTIKILPTGEVYKAEVVKGVKEAEPYYNGFIEEIEKARFPRVKSDNNEGYQAYEITLPVHFKISAD